MPKDKMFINRGRSADLALIYYTVEMITAQSVYSLHDLFQPSPKEKSLKPTKCSRCYMSKPKRSVLNIL